MKQSKMPKKRNGFLGYDRLNLPLLLMLIPGLVWVALFVYYPFVGNIIAFKKFVVTKGIFGSKWIGLGNFEALFRYPNFDQILYNTVFIAVSKIVLGILVAVLFALMLNEVRSRAVSRVIQTVVYLPHFLSWVILSGILVDILSNNGIVNQFIVFLGGSPINFLGDEKVFPYTIIVSDVWKTFGYSAIIYLAALTGIDPTLYEAATIDGAGRIRQTWHITLPGIRTTVVLMSTLALGNVLNAGFDQIFTLYNPAVYSTGDIIDTVVYRLGMEDARYGVSTAASLFKSAISLVLVAISYRLADRFAGYQIF